MSDLLDASVWVPLAAPDHLHHDRPRRYWHEELVGTAAFCRVTALALLRHLTNRHVMQHGVLTGGEAWEEYARWLSLPEIRFLTEPPGVERHLRQFARALNPGPALWTDAYLAAFAIAGGCRMVTFDA